jgi:hypothetical protein
MTALSGGSWGAWQPLGGQLSAAPAAAAWGTDRLDVVVRGTDNGLYSKFFDGAAWSAYLSRGGALSAAPGLSTWGPKRLDVVIRGTDNALWHTWSNG